MQRIERPRMRRDPDLSLHTLAANCPSGMTHMTHITHSTFALLSSSRGLAVPTRLHVLFVDPG